MTANLFGTRFASHREPAWHNLGQVFEEPFSAIEGFRRMGPYEVELVKVRGNIPIGPLPYWVIVRHPTTDDPRYRTFGIVKDGYGLVRPEEFCQIWDEHVAQPAETIGALGYGETMFISTKLPDFNVRGDEVENYLLAVSPMTGGNVAEVRITPVRVVCQNTLILSGQMASEIYRVIHDASAKERLASWLSNVVERAHIRAVVMQEAFDILAGHAMNQEDVDTVLEKAYPMPHYPRENAPPEVMAVRLKEYDAFSKTLQQRRGIVQELFEGKGRGMDAPAAHGTAWGFYNAVCEWEDYRRGRGDASIARDALFGSRAATKTKAFEACLSVSTN